MTTFGHFYSFFVVFSRKFFTTPANAYRKCWPKIIQRKLAPTAKFNESIVNCRCQMAVARNKWNSKLSDFINNYFLFQSHIFAYFYYLLDESWSMIDHDDTRRHLFLRKVGMATLGRL
jgi:hypothetical protein